MCEVWRGVSMPLPSDDLTHSPDNGGGGSGVVWVWGALGGSVGRSERLNRVRVCPVLLAGVRNDLGAGDRAGALVCPRVCLVVCQG